MKSWEAIGEIGDLMGWETVIWWVLEEREEIGGERENRGKKKEKKWL